MPPARFWNCAWLTPWATQWSRRTPVPTCWRSVVKLCRDGPTIWTARRNRCLPAFRFMALSGSVALPYRWFDDGLIAAEQAGAGPPLGVRLDVSLWAKFRGRVPDGCVRAAEDLRELGEGHGTRRGSAGGDPRLLRIARSLSSHGRPQAPSCRRPLHQRKSAPLLLLTRQQGVLPPPRFSAMISGLDMESEPEPCLVPFSGESVPVAHRCPGPLTVPATDRTLATECQSGPGHA